MIEEKISKIFDQKIDINGENLTVLSTDPLDLELRIDRHTYESVIASYGQVLRDLFEKNQIYVLTKIKEHKNIFNVIAILFKNSKKAVMSEIKAFSPCFLIKSDGLDLLVVEETDKIHIYELDTCDQKSFVFRGYRYRIANEIELK